MWFPSSYITWYNNPEDQNMNFQDCENLKCYILHLIKIIFDGFWIMLNIIEGNEYEMDCKN